MESCELAGPPHGRQGGAPGELPGPEPGIGSPPAASAGPTDRGGLDTVCQPRGRAGAPRAVHGVRPGRPLKTVGSDFRELQAVEESESAASSRLLNKTWLSLSDVLICQPWNFIIKGITLFHTVSFSQPIMPMICVRQNYSILFLFQRQEWRKDVVNRALGKN